MDNRPEAFSSDSYFQAIIESSDDAIISKDLSGIVTSWNPGASKIFGYSAAEMVGQPMLKLFPPDRSHEESEILKRIIAGEKADHFDTVRIRKDGQLINISATISPIRNNLGEIIGASKVARDITEKNRYESIFSLSPDGFVTFDHLHHISHASEIVERLIGMPRGRLIGRGLDEFIEMLNQYSHDDDLISGKDYFLKVTQDRLPLTLRRKIFGGGGPQVISIQARKANEGLVGLVVCIRDISYESHVERLKSEFMATAAHELRTPMTSILGFIDLLLLRGEAMTGAERKQLLDIVQEQATLINSIMDDLLDLNKLETRSASDLQMTTLDIVDLLRDVLNAWPTPPGRLPASLQTDESSIKTRGDKICLRRAIMNLLSNAFKYSSGADKITLNVDVDSENKEFLNFSISDEGRGMSKEQLSRYGERFYRADESGAIPGTGLGVSIVKKIIEIHGGIISIQSNLGVGTCVSIKLPHVRD